jgi:hypothetical protein
MDSYRCVYLVKSLCFIALQYVIVMWLCGYADRLQDPHYAAEIPKMWGASLGKWPCWSSEGREFLVWGTLILNEICVQYKLIIYFGRHCAELKYFTYYFQYSFWLRTINNKFCRQLKFERMLFISWTLCQICLFEFIWVEGCEVHKTFKGRHKLQYFGNLWYIILQNSVGK